MLHDANAGVRVEAIEAVVARAAVEPGEVGEWLRDKNLRVVELGLKAIPWLGPAAHESVPVLDELIADRRNAVPNSIRSGALHGMAFIPEGVNMNRISAADAARRAPAAIHAP